MPSTLLWSTCKSPHIQHLLAMQPPYRRRDRGSVHFSSSHFEPEASSYPRPLTVGCLGHSQSAFLSPWAISLS
jgi:hypothetical protein